MVKILVTAIDSRFYLERKNMKNKLEKIICWVIYLVSFCAVVFTIHSENILEYIIRILGAFGLYTIGRYDGHNDI